MTTAVQRRRGTATEHSSFTGLEGELSVNTTNESVHVHDGSTAGGFELMRADGSNSSVTLGDISGVTAGTGLSGGGTSGTVTLDIDSTVTTLDGTQTLTNKTLTSPTLNTPTIGTSFTIGGATITEAELEILDGATVTTTELNYVDGVTSSIQTQIDAKAPLASPTFTGTVTMDGLTVDTNTLYVDSTNNRVGIGTTSPDQKLEVDGAVKVTNFFTGETSTNSGYFDFVPSTSTARITTKGNDGSTLGKFQILQQASDGSPSATPFYIDTNSNVGIGMTPTARLSIRPSGSGSEDSHFGFGANRDTYISTSSTGTIIFRNASERMRIDSSGNVGIGTSSPSQKLHIDSGEALIKSAYNASGTTNSKMYFASRQSGDWRNSFIGNTGDALTFATGGTGTTHTNATERMRIDSSGNVKIGNPNKGVSDAGEGVLFSGALPGLSYFTRDGGLATSHARLNSYGGVIRVVANGNSAGQIGSGSSGALSFYNGAGSTERMRIDSSGNLLVGKSSSAFGTDGIQLNVDQLWVTNTSSSCMSLNRKGTSGTILNFYDDGSLVGSISTNANSLPSDRNFKRNIKDLTLGLDFVESLNPVTYNYKIDNEGQAVMTGLIAQEVEEALTAAGVEKNSMTLLQHKPTEDVNESDYQMDYLKFVPILINSIKEQQTLIESLTARIAALEE